MALLVFSVNSIQQWFSSSSGIIIIIIATSSHQTTCVCGWVAARRMLSLLLLSFQLWPISIENTVLFHYYYCCNLIINYNKNIIG